MQRLLTREDIEALVANPSQEIVGVEFKLLNSFGDERGFFREVIRVSDPIFGGGQFAQWSHSCMQEHVVKAWHYHHLQTDWWYIPIGEVQAALIDYRPESPTYRKVLAFKMGETSRLGSDTQEICVRIPPGVLHGCRVLSGPAHLMYITSKTYNKNDEGRYPFDSNDVGFDWGPDAIVADNDRVAFVPTSARTLVA